MVEPETPLHGRKTSGELVGGNTGVESVRCGSERGNFWTSTPHRCRQQINTRPVAYMNMGSCPSSAGKPPEAEPDITYQGEEPSEDFADEVCTIAVPSIAPSSSLSSNLSKWALKLGA